MRRARGRHHGRSAPGVLNKTEAEYADYLEREKTRGHVEWYAFEPIKLRLADRTFYTPDFLVMLHDLSLEVHEVKGHWEDDARVKIKVAAEMFPFVFRAITKRRKRDGGGWDVEVFGGAQ